MSDVKSEGTGLSAIERYLAPVLETILGVLPGSGEVMSARDSYEYSRKGLSALRRGDYGDAAGNYGLSALAGFGAVPFVGMVGRGASRLLKPPGIVARPYDDIFPFLDGLKSGRIAPQDDLPPLKQEWFAGPNITDDVARQIAGVLPEDLARLYWNSNRELNLGSGLMSSVLGAKDSAALATEIFRAFPINVVNPAYVARALKDDRPIETASRVMLSAPTVPAPKYPWSRIALDAIDSPDVAITTTFASDRPKKK